jgi:hypothetical protein
LLKVLVDNAAFAADADIVVEQINAAIGIRRRVHGRFACGFNGYVSGIGHGFTAFIPDHLNGLFRQRFIQVDYDDFHARPGEQNAGRTAIANAVFLRAAAGYNGDFACNPIIFFRHALPLINARLGQA